MSRGSEPLPLRVTNSMTSPVARNLVQAGIVNGGLHFHHHGEVAPGTRLRAVLGQQELIDGLGDFKKNLTGDRLPFVSPGDDHPAHPAQLFEKLRRSDERGVLLVGSAGTGKTRTGIEVGDEALRAGWRALHVMPGDERGTLDELVEQVLAEPSPVLVVIDYFNEAQLDSAVLRHRLIPQARRNNIPVAVLASARPGWLHKADRTGLRKFFDEVELRQDDSFQRLVTENALHKLAPTAVRRFGMPHMMEVSGRRPIIALLVGREIERRVTAGISLPEATALRSGGELSAWLESRLKEDDLAVPGRADHFTPAQASSGLLAAAAAVAACPQPLPEVTAAAHACLVAAGSATPKAEHLVATLISCGWLEQDNGVLAIAHDAVADQLVESVLLPEGGTTPDVSRIEALLAGCLTDPRTIGRFAVNLGRLVGDLELAGRAEALTPVLDDWFTANAATIGRVLRLSSHVGGYALGAICSGAPWSRATVRCWEQVVGLWLRDFGGGVDARHLIFRGLRHLPPDGARLLVPAALAWLGTHWRRRDASYVLASLVSRADLPPESVRDVIARALRWLKRHPTAPDTRFVLASLLARTDLEPRDSTRLATATLAWLDHHPTGPDTRFVLGSLLARTDLGAHDAQRAIAVSLAWLEDHPTAPDARHVLRRLLSRTDLEPRDSARLATATLAWLGDHPTDLESQFVLRRLLSRFDLDPRHSARAISAALLWLDRHGAEADARFVLRPLLFRPDLGPHHTERAVAAATKWLEGHPTIPDSQLVRVRLADLSGDAPDLKAWLTHPAGREARGGAGERSTTRPGIPGRADSLPRYDLAIRTTRSPRTPPGLAANEMEIPWTSAAGFDPKSATVDALKASGLTLGDAATAIVFIAPPGAPALPVYAALAGFTHRWVDAYVDGSVLGLADYERNPEVVGEVVRPDGFLLWAQVGGPPVDGMPTAAFPREPDAWPDGTAAGVVRHAARLRMVPPEPTSAALHMLVKVTALRAQGGGWRLPVLSTGAEPLPADKSTEGQGVDLEVIRQAAWQYRKEVVKAGETVEVVPVRQVSPFDRRIAEANATDTATLLRRLGAASDDGSRWTCPRDQGDRAPHVLKVRGGGLVSCKNCYPRPVGLVRLAMDVLRLTPDEAAAFVLDDADDFPARGMAVTARVVGSLPNAYRCTIRNPLSGREHAAVLPAREFQELHRTRPGSRPAKGDVLVALVMTPADGALLVGPAALDGADHVLCLTDPALVERVLPGFVPELTTGELVIMRTARVPGARSRIAVAPTRPTNSVRGSLIGVRAERKDGYQRLLSSGMTDEEIEIVPYSSDMRTMLANALAYAQPTDILTDGRRAVVAVSRRQYRGTIGRGGLNAQLAGQLTGMYVKIVPSGTDLALAMEVEFDDE